MANQTDNTSSSIIAVPFQADTLIAVEREDGIYIAIRPICERIGVDWSAQLKRVKNDPVLSEAVAMTATPFTRHGQDETCLKLDYLNGWLMGIDVRRVKPMVRGALIEYQRECHRVLFEHFFRKTGSYRAASRQQGLSPEERAERSALAARRMRVNEVHAATRSLEALRRASGSRAAALAAPQIYAALGVNIDPDASDTLAQGELPLDNTVH